LINVLDAVAIMSHAIVNKQETRKLREIIEVINVSPDGIAQTNIPFNWKASENAFYFSQNRYAFNKIAKRYGADIGELNQELQIRAKLLYEMYRRKIFDFAQVQSVVNKYHKSPEAVLQAFGIQGIVKSQVAGTQAGNQNSSENMGKKRDVVQGRVNS
jgi:hypothetical protein